MPGCENIAGESVESDSSSWGLLEAIVLGYSLLGTHVALQASKFKTAPEGIGRRVMLGTMLRISFLPGVRKKARIMELTLFLC